MLEQNKETCLENWNGSNRTECNKKVVYEVVPGGLFGIGRGEVVIFVAVKIFDKLLDDVEGRFKRGLEHLTYFRCR